MSGFKKRLPYFTVALVLICVNLYTRSTSNRGPSTVSLDAKVFKDLSIEPEQDRAGLSSRQLVGWNEWFTNPAANSTSIKDKDHRDPVETVIIAGVSGTNASGPTLSRAQCFDKYGHRQYARSTERRLPPMLYTFPGSGNTWARLLIEYSTNIYTGSVYNDKTLLKALPGEFKCNWEVSVIKVHPHTHGFEGLRTGRFHSDAEKCKRGGIKKFESAVLLIRDPFDSVWSEYQRRVTQSHVLGLKKNEFDWNRWQANAANLANGYHDMWQRQHMSIEKHFQPSDILYVKYEDLKNASTRVAALIRIEEFVLRGRKGTGKGNGKGNVPHRKELSSSSSLVRTALSTEHAECAFTLAENRQAHRQIDPATKNQYMFKEQAYTKELACRMWALFGEYASRHGYKSRNFDCTTEQYPKIQKVSVGPQGEYNRKYIRKEPIDFGGYNKDEYPTRERLNALEQQKKDRERKAARAAKKNQRNSLQSGFNNPNHNRNPNSNANLNANAFHEQTTGNNGGGDSGIRKANLDLELSATKEVNRQKMLRNKKKSTSTKMTKGKGKGGRRQRPALERERDKDFQDGTVSKGSQHKRDQHSSTWSGAGKSEDPSLESGQTANRHVDANRGSSGNVRDRDSDSRSNGDLDLVVPKKKRKSRGSVGMSFDDATKVTVGGENAAPVGANKPAWS